MTDDFRFGWELGGAGWATCRIAEGSAEHVDVVGHCTDALGDLLRGVVGLYGSDAVQRFSFDLEPVEARWVLRRHGSGVDIAIRHFPDLYARRRAADEEGELSWSSTQPRRVLGHAVLNAAQSVLRLHGEQGYRKKWQGHLFPAAELAELRRLHLRDDRCGRPHNA
ncbi:hypothetical protein [Streptomyces sp. UNOB3_S3]|uniref:hypothetical protein n=1 Tax=Streptomyces sp. UNOB3_S3 TaxID=2871682 RepID=UPI001E3FEC42|nr:hypothetical protein [Streptomyces sp. UNOB3_S3]MCC3774611.1 hypothetical protein [Streptomyces sp. UNOB3_S3]